MLKIFLYFIDLILFTKNPNFLIKIKCSKKIFIWRNLVFRHFYLTILINSEIRILVSSHQIIRPLIRNKKCNKMIRENKLISVLRDFPPLFMNRKFSNRGSTKFKPKTIFIQNKSCFFIKLSQIFWLFFLSRISRNSRDLVKIWSCASSLISLLPFHLRRIWKFWANQLRSLLLSISLKCWSSFEQSIVMQIIKTNILIHFFRFLLRIFAPFTFSSLVFVFDKQLFDFDETRSIRLIKNKH